MNTGTAAHTQVCLVSAQAAPNLTPLLDAAFRPKRLVMLVSADMKKRAAWLADVARTQQIKVETLALADAWDLAGITDVLVNWLDAQGAAADVALNVTGGTKPMAMAAQQVFAMADKPVFYVQHQSDDVLWLLPRRPRQTLANKLKLEPYLHAHGWEVVDRPQTAAFDAGRRALCESLVLKLALYERSLGRLNGYVRTCAGKKWLRVPLSDADAADAGFRQLLSEFTATDACRVEDGELRFADEEARFFCGGGWLELFVLDVLEHMRAALGIQDLASSIKVRSVENRLDGGHGGNEFDVAFLAHNRLHIVECKTGNFSANESAAPAVYKLDSLTGMGGSNTRGMLVSYRDLVSGDRQRAKDLKIQTIEGSQLATLRDRLSKWIKAIP